MSIASNTLELVAAIVGGTLLLVVLCVQCVRVWRGERPARNLRVTIMGEERDRP